LLAVSPLASPPNLLTHKAIGKSVGAARINA